MQQALRIAVSAGIYNMSWWNHVTATVQKTLRSLTAGAGAGMMGAMVLGVTHHVLRMMQMGTDAVKA